MRIILGVACLACILGWPRGARPQAPGSQIGHESEAEIERHLALARRTTERFVWVATADRPKVKLCLHLLGRVTAIAVGNQDGAAISVDRHYLKTVEKNIRRLEGIPGVKINPDLLKHAARRHR